MPVIAGRMFGETLDGARAINQTLTADRFSTAGRPRRPPGPARGDGAAADPNAAPRHPGAADPDGDDHERRPGPDRAGDGG
ncbi:hypothetical protein, partial [Methylobacterium radiotolerans]|uniref:hypothetical protein n=1 Tax=Methylobacterium radiotolerans TaxID=31998 RepID=UPI003CCA0737